MGVRYRKPVFSDLVQETSKEILAKSLYFVPNPVSVQFLTKEEALETGHYQVAFSETIIYQIIIKDWSDRELWINYPLNSIPKKKQQSMRELMNMIGVNLEAEKLSDKIMGWLGRKSRIYYCKHDEEERISLIRDFNCPYCNHKNRMDFSDDCEQVSSEESMGDKIQYIFNNDEYECNRCGKQFRVKGYICEYPLGCIDDEDIETIPIEPVEEEDDE
jgi:transcription elongation factor Elf1